MWHAALALLVLTAEPAPDDAFRWLDPGADAAVFRQVATAFREELKPDDPVEAEMRSLVPVVTRRLDRIGLAGTHALVLIRNADETGALDGAWFDPWNFDLATGRKEPVPTQDALYEWRFRGLASFERTVVPDVVFQYFNCWACESTLSLASFRFDGGSGLWSARCWFHFDEEVDFVEIEKATQHYEDEDVKYEFRHAIRDVTGDGLADIVVGRNDTGLTTMKTNERLLVHTWVDGRPVTRPPTDAEVDAVKAALFPHGPPPRVSKPRRGRFSNPRYGYAVAFPKDFEAVLRFEDGDWQDGIFIPLPGGPVPEALHRAGWGIGILGNENVWIMQDPEKPPQPEPGQRDETRRSTRVRTKLAGLPAWRVVTRTTREGVELVEDKVRAFRRVEPDQPGESGDACWVHFIRYELSLDSPARSYPEDRKVFDQVLASFRLTPLP